MVLFLPILHVGIGAGNTDNFNRIYQEIFLNCTRLYITVRGIFE